GVLPRFGAAEIEQCECGFPVAAGEPLAVTAQSIADRRVGAAVERSPFGAARQRRGIPQREALRPADQRLVVRSHREPPADLPRLDDAALDEAAAVEAPGAGP